MDWIEVTIRTAAEAEEMVSNFMHELGAGGVSIEESSALNRKRDTSFGQWYELQHNHIPEGEIEIKGYFADQQQQQIEALVKQLEQSVQGLKRFGINIGNARITYKKVDEQDWANEWKSYYKPVKISERLVIKPTWENYEAAEQEIILELDPGMAFGTGTHETTALCLRTIEQVIQAGDEVIDVGTGSGILAIAAAKLGAKHVLAIDLDPVAVSSAKENARLNGLSERVTVRQGDLLGVLSSQDLDQDQDQDQDQAGKELDLGIKTPVQLVVANILAEIIITFVEDVFAALDMNGKYIASGIIRKKEAEVAAALTAAGFTIEYTFYENDWLAIVAVKL